MNTCKLITWSRIAVTVVVLLTAAMYSSVYGQEQRTTAIGTSQKELTAQTEPGVVAVVNNYCPIMGNVIDPDGTSIQLQRVFKNQPIGFYSVDCLVTWDGLTTSEKDAKLAKVWPIINNYCPVTGKKIDKTKIPGGQILIHDGQRIGFCSAECIPAWDKYSASEKDLKLKKVLHVVNTLCPMTSGQSIDPNKVPDAQTLIYKGQKIGFCSGQCLSDWNKLSVAQKNTGLKKVLPVVNLSCPISSDSIDQVTLPVDQTQMFLGQKIGFHSKECLEKWNKLIIEDKENKLKNAMLLTAKQETKPASAEKL